jgi:hypothetical protein
VDDTPPTVTAGAIDSCYPDEASAEAAAIAATSASDNCTALGNLMFSASTSGDCEAVITVTVTDESYNSDSVTYNTRIDGTPPVIYNVPDDIEVPADAGTCTAVVTWDPPYATDNCTLSLYPGSIGAGSLTVSNSSPAYVDDTWRAEDAVFGSSHNSGTSISQATAIQGFVNLSDAAMPGAGEWSKYYAKMILWDDANRRVDVVFGTDWLGGWHGIDPQPWDRIRLENNMGLAQPYQYYCTEGGTHDMHGGGTIYPSTGTYYFQLIADPVAKTFTLQVYGKGSSAPIDGVGWPAQNTLNEPTWLEIGTISAPSFNFANFGMAAQLWAPIDEVSESVELSTVSWEALNWGEPLTLDQTPDAISVTSTHPPGDTFPVGTTTVTYTFTDQCGNSAQASFDVTVNAVNELAVTVELQSVSELTLDRCIRFKLWDCDTSSSLEISEVLTFVNGVAQAVLEVPCSGTYSCITAQDPLHTLRSTAIPVISGTQYVASFTGDWAGGGNWLVGGNLNDDNYIDILDFGVFAGQYNLNYGTGDTTCTTPFPHADISGDGLVYTADYSFIQINFLKIQQADCLSLCPLGLVVASPVDTTISASGTSVTGKRVGQQPPADEGPLASITVQELRKRGLHDLVVADLNGDGVVDQMDMVLWMQGVRPQTKGKK